MTGVIRRATPADAAALVACHVACLGETYVDSGIMPPAFLTQHLARLDELGCEKAADLAAGLAAEARGEEPVRREWLALDAAGEVVGTVSSGDGPARWDSSPPPPVRFNLDHLYTLRRTHGTGLGQALLDVALPGHREAYLWVLVGNPRATAMYRRNGFVDEGYAMTCGETWFERPMVRMYRTRELAIASRQAQCVRKV